MGRNFSTRKNDLLIPLRIADKSTTARGVTVQAQILELLKARGAGVRSI